MLRANAVVTALARKYKTVLIVFGLLSCAGAGFVYQASQRESLMIKDRTFNVEIMDTPELRAQGLSGRDGIGKDDAMLFSFEGSDQRCFWMKDMQFPIDMVWVDGSGKVVAIEEDVRPESYPTNYCHTASQVIELAAGTAARIKLVVGDQAQPL